MHKFTFEEYRGLNLVVPIGKVPPESRLQILEFVAGFIMREPILLTLNSFRPNHHEVSGGFLLRREDGLLIPTSIISPNALEGFNGDWPDSELVIENDSDVDALLTLQDLWIRNNPELYGNIDIAPMVETRDWGSMRGNLYVSQVKTGFFKKEKFWFLRKECWTEEWPKTFSLGWGF